MCCVYLTTQKYPIPLNVETGDFFIEPLLCDKCALLDRFTDVKCVLNMRNNTSSTIQMYSFAKSK